MAARSLRVRRLCLFILAICVLRAAETVVATNDNHIGEESSEFLEWHGGKVTAREMWTAAFGPDGNAEMQATLRYSLPPRPDVTKVKPEVYEIAKNPPNDIFELASAVPFTFFLPDKDGSYVVFIQLDKMDMDTLKGVSTEHIVDFIRYIGCVYFGAIDGRPDSRIKVVLDCGELQFSSLWFLGGLSMINVIARALDNLQNLLGERTSDIVIINTSAVLQAMLETVKALMPSNMHLLVLGGPEEYVPQLQELIGKESLPQEYGGTALAAIGESPMALAMEQQIQVFMESRDGGSIMQNETQ
ncbi:CRAL/TRIO domain protein [Toxoplasma gondii TgCatPRC2]|uniref:CRAL/TRIO domain protein n=1 Tax=Toxoplasma gondii TgCatPRC2 TaxID=1130821 RepID=A0A151HD98_TOXGO|nr:CRAL/TRIO domain protein [Toxoplasma gondii TgCatPRC2]